MSARQTTGLARRLAQENHDGQVDYHAIGGGRGTESGPDAILESWVSRRALGHCRMGRTVWGVSTTGVASAA